MHLRSKEPTFLKEACVAPVRCFANIRQDSGVRVISTRLSLAHADTEYIQDYYY